MYNNIVREKENVKIFAYSSLDDKEKKINNFLPDGNSKQILEKIYIKYPKWTWKMKNNIKRWKIIEVYSRSRKREREETFEWHVFIKKEKI